MTEFAVEFFSTDKFDSLPRFAKYTAVSSTFNTLAQQYLLRLSWHQFYFAINNRNKIISVILI